MTDLSLTLNDSRSLSVAVTDDDGNAVDLTGSSLRFTVKESRADADADALMSKTIGAGITVTDAAGGLATIAIDADDWAGFARVPQRLVWDLQETTAGGGVTTLDSGWLVVLVDVTEATP